MLVYQRIPRFAPGDRHMHTHQRYAPGMHPALVPGMTATKLARSRAQMTAIDDFEAEVVRVTLDDGTQCWEWTVVQNLPGNISEPVAEGVTWDSGARACHCARQIIKTMTAEENLPARLGAILGDVERLIEVYEATPEESAIRPVRDTLRAAIRALGGEV